MTGNQPPENTVTGSHRTENAVTGNQPPENTVTGSHRMENAVTDDHRTATKTVKIQVSDINWLNDEKICDESTAATLSRIHQEIDELRYERNKHFEVVALKDSQIDDLKDRIMALESEIETLRSGSSTTLTPVDNQTSLGDFGSAALKDTIDAIKDVCDDESVCIKAALKIVDTKSDLINKQLNRDHVSEEKAKDREEREKDRRLKAEIERDRMRHQRELALIRKGIVSKDDLEDAVFLGSMHTKSAKEIIEEKKRRAYAESEEYDDLPSMTEGFIGEGEDL